MPQDEGLKRFKERFMPNYAPFGRTFVRGEGTLLFDSDGARYLDFCSGIAVNGLGHCHPEVVRAVRDQTGRLMHLSNLYIHDVELELAARLERLTFPGRLFLCQSGAEANEAAIKLARKYFRAVRKENRWKFITAANSFHGRTLATVAATGQDKYKADFQPLPEGFIHVPYNDLDAMAEAMDSETCAILVEPVQGEGGIIIPDDGYLAQLRRLCDREGALLILDEVQTGFGRTGTLFAWQREGIVPDIFTMAKAFGGGLPLGGALAKPEIAAALIPGTHATTFGGNPVTCAAALAVLRVIEEDGLLANAEEMGARIMERLFRLQELHPSLIRGGRGRGLLIGLELSVAARPAMAACQEAGLLLSVVQDKVLRITPPLTVSGDEVDEAMGILGKVLDGIARAKQV